MCFCAQEKRFWYGCKDKDSSDEEDDEDADGATNSHKKYSGNYYNLITIFFILKRKRIQNDFNKYRKQTILYNSVHGVQ